jgi:hypothetical protein
MSRGITVDELLAGVEPHLLSPTFLVGALPWLTVTREEQRELSQGRPVATSDRRIEVPSQPTGEVCDEIAAFDADKNLVAVLRERKPGLLSPVRNFSQAE